MLCLVLYWPQPPHPMFLRLAIECCSLTQLPALSVRYLSHSFTSRSHANGDKAGPFCNLRMGGLGGSSAGSMSHAGARTTTLVSTFATEVLEIRRQLGIVPRGLWQLPAMASPARSCLSSRRRKVMAGVANTSSTGGRQACQTEPQRPASTSATSTQACQDKFHPVVAYCTTLCHRCHT